MNGKPVALALVVLLALTGVAMAAYESPEMDTTIESADADEYDVSLTTANEQDVDTETPASAAEYDVSVTAVNEYDVDTETPASAAEYDVSVTAANEQDVDTETPESAAEYDMSLDIDDDATVAATRTV